MKKEAEKQTKPASLKAQKRQAIRKAKDILKRAEQARRAGIGKKNLNESIKLHGMSFKRRIIGPDCRDGED